MKKRVLSLFMSLMLCLTSLPATALAEEKVVVNGMSAVGTVDGESAPGENDAKEETEVKGGVEETDTEGGKEAGDKTGGDVSGGDANADVQDADKDAVLMSVQKQINALPDVDALSAMEEDEVLAAYMAIQEAYAAYDALTAEQQAQITGADCFEELFGWFNGQIAPLDDGYTDINYASVDTKTGGRISGFTQRMGCVTIDENTEDVGNNNIGVYLLKKDVTLDSLTVDYKRGTNPVLYLGKNTTLTIQGPITFRNGAFLTVYGAEDGSGKIIIENNSDSAAIQAEGEVEGSYLAVCGGELEITSSNGRITDGVYLENGSVNYHYMEYEIDGNPVVYDENKELLGGKTITGKKLTLTWCSHEDEYVTYVPSGGTQHKMNCAKCGFKGDAVDCSFNGNYGYEPDEAGHYVKCFCGNKDSQRISHAFSTWPTDDGKYHTSRCSDCLYVMGGTELKEHTWNAEGACETCHFMPVAKDSLGNLYDGNDDGVTTALDAVADGNGAAYVELYSVKTGDKEISEAVEFEHPGKTVELQMNEYTLNQTGYPTLSVTDGTLKITGDATIKTLGGAQETTGSAISVSGGKLIFENNLTAEGGYWSGTRKPAVTAEGGELEFKAGLDLNGGLTLTGNAKLTNGLTQGKFYAEDDTNGSARVSVENSGVYQHVYDLLADGYAFAESGDTSKLVDAGGKTLTQDVTIVEHTHDYQPVAGSDEYKCACGLTCSHPNGYHNDGKCSVCGKPCSHTNVTEKTDETTGDSITACKGCDKQMLLKIEKGSSRTYSTDFVTATNEAEDGTKITLLADIQQQNWGKRARISGDNKIVTLDLNGHKIIDGWIEVGKSEGYDDYTKCTSCTLKIVGNGSYEKTGVSGDVEVQMKATLDLTGWTGGTISEIGIRDHSGYPVNEREATLIIGPNAGTIQKLWFGNNQLPAITKTKLSGGSYGEIYVPSFGVPIQLGNLLKKGYAFQNADGTYVDYTKKLAGSTINNVTVVKCPHDKIENDTCAYCGMTGILATLNGVTYTSADSNIIAAVADWRNNGGGLKLFVDYTNDAFAFSGASNPLTIDLNGHDFNKGKNMSLSGADLTIKDTAKTGNGTFGKLSADNGMLILESGALEELNVPENSPATICIRGGQFTAGEIAVPVYRMLESGYCLMNGNITVNPATEKLSNGQTYWGKEADITPAGGESGTITIGENKVPNEVSLLVRDSDVAQVQFRWYLIKDDSVAQLAEGGDVWLSAGLDGNTCVYEPNPEDCKEFTDAGWKDLKADETYELICVVIGKISDGAYRWQTVLKGYEMTVEKASLDSEKTVITQKAGTGNTLAGGERLVIKPNARWNNLDDVTYRFDVFYNGKKLTAGTDYTIKENSNTAQDAGEHELTVVGIGNYTGEKTVTWKIEPYELSYTHMPTQIRKEYDGTDTADETVEGVASLGCFIIDSSNQRNPVVETGGSGSIDLRDSVDKTNLHFDSAEVGDRTFYVTLTLKDNNFVFADGAKMANFELSQKNAGDPAVSISKKPVAEPVAKDLSVVNGLATTYTFDLAGMLPKLDSPMEYGDVQYTITSVILDSDYYTTTNQAYVEDGKLKLPTLASTKTGNQDVGSITVKAISSNISDITLTINVKAADKIVPTLNGELNLSKTELTYGDKLSTITISGTMTDPTTNETVKGTFEWVSPDKAMDAAGKYDAEWKFVPDNTDFYAEATGTAPITVKKATPAGEPTYTAITAGGKKLSDAALTASDKWPAGTLEWIDDKDIALSEDTEVMVNTTYRWRFTPTDSNYNILAGEIELYHVDAPAITSQPKSVSVVTGERAVFEVAAMGTALTYQWKIDRNDGKGFVDIAGANGASYTSGVTDKDCDGFKYQCVISNAAGSVTTDTVVLTVKDKYIIAASAGAHGSISPSGDVEVVEGSNQTFVITAEEGYGIESLMVDGKSVNAAASYTFENVTAAHTIAVTFKVEYRIIDGADSAWTQNTDGSFVIRGNGAFSKFVNVKVDGQIIDSANYTVREGSTIVELKADYLKTLSAGSHTFELTWTDGAASTSFTVAKNTSGGNNNNNNNGNSNNNNSSQNNNENSSNTTAQGKDPNTGDTSHNVIWYLLTAMSVAGLAVLAVIRNRKKNDCE